MHFPYAEASTEHLAAASASFSMGRARPEMVGMVDGSLCRAQAQARELELSLDDRERKEQRGGSREDLMGHIAWSGRWRVHRTARVSRLGRRTEDEVVDE